MNVGWKSSHLGEPARLTGPTHLQPEVLSKASVDVLYIDETKLDASFPDHQFKISGWWEIVFVREGFMVKQMKNFDTENDETVFLKLQKEVLHPFCFPTPRHK